jgi:hypothetical protein
METFHLQRNNVCFYSRAAITNFASSRQMSGTPVVCFSGSAQQQQQQQQQQQCFMDKIHQLKNLSKIIGIVSAH